MTADEVREILRMAQLPVSSRSRSARRRSPSWATSSQDESAPVAVRARATTNLRKEDIERALDVAART